MAVGYLARSPPFARARREVDGGDLLLPNLVSLMGEVPLAFGNAP